MGDSVLTSGFWSRYTRHKVFGPSATNNAEKFGQTLLKELERTNANSQKAVLFPMEDASLNWVAKHRELVERHAYLLIPPPEALKIAQDKGRTLGLATELGIPCPKTWEPKSAMEFTEIVLSMPIGSFIVKPRSGSGSMGVSYGDSRTAKAWQDIWAKFGAMLIQERVPPEGRGQGVSLLMDGNGKCVATFVHERLQQYPNSGGPSSDRKSIHAPQLLEWSLALLHRLQWRGVAMVEWKLDPRDGKPKLMEINPRFWGSLELAVRAGVDFPTLYARAAMC